LIDCLIVLAIKANSNC